MGATLLPLLMAAYKAGNKPPRGHVIEHIQWRALRTHIPAGGSPCKAGQPWRANDYIDLVKGIVPGVTLADLARVQSRTTTSVLARLKMLGLVWHDRCFQPFWRVGVRAGALRVELAYKKGSVDLTRYVEEMRWVKYNGGYSLPAGLAGKSVLTGACATPRVKRRSRKG